MNKPETVVLSTAELTSLETLLSKNVNEIKDLVKEIENEKINPKNLLQQNFFLYDNSNFTKSTLLTELNKSIQLYGEIDVGVFEQGKKIKLISPDTAIKFNIKKNVFKENLQFQLEDIRQKFAIKAIDNKICNITILKMPVKKRRTYSLIDSIHIIGFENFQNYEKLNLITVNIENNNLIAYLNNKKYSYRFTLNSIIFSAGMTEKTDIIHIICDGLSDANCSLINKELLTSLGQINVNEIQNFDVAMEQKKWTNCVFTESQTLPSLSKHFAFPFIMNNLRNLLSFNISFLNKNGELIKWPTDEEKVPSISFTIAF